MARTPRKPLGAGAGGPSIGEPIIGGPPVDRSSETLIGEQYLREPAGAESIAGIPIIGGRKSAEPASVLPPGMVPAIPAPTGPSSAGFSAEMPADAMIDAAIEAVRKTEDATAAALAEGTRVMAEAPQAVADAMTKSAPLPEAVAAPISEAATAPVAAAVEAASAVAPVVAAAPVRAAEAFASGVAAWCESGVAIARGFERMNARLTDVACGNLRDSLDMQRALFGLGTSDALARRGTFWVGERIGSFAAVPGELAMIAFETAEAAAKPVVAQAQARFTGGAAGRSM